MIVSGCSIGDVRRTPPAPTSSAPTPASTDPSGPPPSPAPVAETRRTRLAVPERYDPPFVEFVDAEQGYALFGACDGRPPGPDCRALLWSTRDGGRTWQRLRHPKPVADNQQMYAAPGVLALWAEPHGWWTSTDNGKTFRHTPGEKSPPQWQAAQGRFQLIVDSGKVGRWDGRKLRPLPAQPPVPVLNTVAEGDGRIVTQDGTEYGGPLVVAGAGEDGRLHTAISIDEGRSWQKTPVPAPEGEVGVLRVQAVGELWLIGERPDRTSFPALWRLEGRDWKLVSAEGHPPRGWAVPLGGGIAAVVSPRGAGAVAEGRYVDLPWPLTGDHLLRLLPDGTLFAGAQEEILLGVGTFADLTWTAVILETD
ncbi:hypothetical protein C1I95_19830 [Micromonospora craterilacus]|uniref:Exo-alpha-sialidase n=1 Tax=Micromonospora craterilacus TaxID=1655439 RepID=A0A2W2EED6_9ACTN|nr:hypothetical protein C1I95_19830 [Micromonospora craterilacus]